MKRNKWIIVGMTIVLLLGACTKKEEKLDFWEETYRVLHQQIEGNSYQEGDWNIVIEEEQDVEKEDHYNILISQIKEEKDTSYRVVFALQNHDGDKQVVYMYEKSIADGERTQDYRIKVFSIDETYHQYQIQYTQRVYVDGNYQDGKEAEGSLSIEGDSFVYDNVPLLNEMMEKEKEMLDAFQNTFEMNYRDFDFVNVPSLALQQNIPKMSQMSDETSLTTDYYAEMRSNARGYSLIPYLRINKDGSGGEFGTYDIDRQVKAGLQVTFEKRGSEKIYHMIQPGDQDKDYACYIMDDRVYMYDQTWSNVQIEEDVISYQGDHAVFLFDIHNPGF